MRQILIFVFSAAFMLCVFYFYPAEIFQVRIKGGLAEILADVSLKCVLFKTDFPAGLIAENITSVKITLQGILLMAACFVGLPAMIALRAGKKKA